MKKFSDTELYKWNLLLSGEEQAFYKCFNLCYDDLYRLGIFLYKDAELARECIHLLFIELWKLRNKMLEVVNVKEYVLTIYKRILYKQKMALIKHWSKIDLIDNTTDLEEKYTASYEEMMINTQESELQRNRLLAVLPLLAERQKQLIRMRYFEEKSIEEIALFTCLTPRTVYNTIYNALAKLKELIG